MATTTPDPTMPDKTCFVIAPIGEDGSEVRKRDRMFKYVIEPAALKCGYKAVRVDKIPNPGIITNQQRSGLGCRGRAMLRRGGT